jgi:tetratricopeptide (TPR) repeat protein
MDDRPESRSGRFPLNASLWRQTAAGLIFAAVAVSGCEAASELQRQVKFGIESAERGLWQEAIFRWKRALDINPYSAIVHNNMAVAYETLGEFDEAAKSYEKALQYSKNRYEEIRENYEQFMAFYSIYRQTVDDEAAPD